MTWVDEQSIAVRSHVHKLTLQSNSTAPKRSISQIRTAAYDEFVNCITRRSPGAIVAFHLLLDEPSLFLYFRDAQILSAVHHRPAGERELISQDPLRVLHQDVERRPMVGSSAGPYCDSPPDVLVHI